MHDILPDEISVWYYFESITKRILSKNRYQEIRLPIIEKKSLFYKSVGMSTDIIEKETYDLQDKNNEFLSLRPEGTSSCVRAVIEHNLLRKKINKLWYLGPMFRYEKPQKGRYRQFHQLGIEIYGNCYITQDAELLTLIWSIWKNIKIEKDVVLEINNIGTQKERNKYKKYLVNYLKPLESKLDGYSKKRLYTNPFRILDSKNINTKNILSKAPTLLEFLSAKSQKDFQELVKYLKEAKIPVRLNKFLVRGLDYYSDTIFEYKILFYVTFFSIFWLFLKAKA